MAEWDLTRTKRRFSSRYNRSQVGVERLSFVPFERTWLTIPHSSFVSNPADSNCDPDGRAVGGSWILRTWRIRMHDSPSNCYHVHRHPPSDWKRLCCQLSMRKRTASESDGPCTTRPRDPCRSDVDSEEQ